MPAQDRQRDGVARLGVLRPRAGNTLVTVANASQHRDVRDQVFETFNAL